jgi:hypothetical protein
MQEQPEAAAMLKPSEAGIKKEPSGVDRRGTGRYYCCNILRQVKKGTLV